MPFPRGEPLMREQRTNNKRAGDSILRWCDAEDPRGAGAHACCLRSEAGSTGTDNQSDGSQVASLEESEWERKPTQTAGSHTQTPGRKVRAGIKLATFRLWGADQRRFPPNLPNDRIANAAATRQQRTERPPMCASFQQIQKKKKKNQFPFVRHFNGNQALNSVCCSTCVRCPSPALREYWMDRQGGQMESRSVPLGALTTLRTVVCGYAVPLRFQKNRFYSSD